MPALWGQRNEVPTVYTLTPMTKSAPLCLSWKQLDDSLKDISLCFLNITFYYLFEKIVHTTFFIISTLTHSPNFLPQDPSSTHFQLCLITKKREEFFFLDVVVDDLISDLFHQPDRVHFV